MECTVLKLSFNDSPTFLTSEDFMSYMFNYYPRDNEIVLSETKNHGITFCYVKDNVLNTVNLAKNHNLSESHLALLSDNGTCYPSTTFKVQDGYGYATIRVHDYTGSSDEMNLLFTRLVAYGECNVNNDPKTTTGELDNYISTNSKTYAIDDVLTSYNDSSKEFWELDSSEQYSTELGQWFHTHIDSNLSKGYTLLEFIENNP